MALSAVLFSGVFQLVGILTEMSAEFDAVFVTRDGEIYITEGLENSASAIEGGAPLQILR